MNLSDPSSRTLEEQEKDLIPPDLFYDPKLKRKDRKGLSVFPFLVIGIILGIVFFVPFSFSVSGIAHVEPGQDLVVESLVNGELLELDVHEGQLVRKGQKIGLIYDRTNDQDLFSAQANLKIVQEQLLSLGQKAEFMKKEAETNRFLYTKDAITAYEKEKSDYAYQSVLQEINMQKTRLENLRERIHYFETLKQIGTVKAPMDGIVMTKVSNKLSTYFMKGEEILKIANMDDAKLTMPVLEHQLWRLREGAPVKVKFFSYPDQVFTGKIESFQYSAYQKTEKVWVKEGAVDAVIRLDRKIPFAVKSGMTAKVTVEGQGQSLFTKLRNTLWV